MCVYGSVNVHRKLLSDMCVYGSINVHGNHYQICMYYAAKN
jgi:hypothetical protein